MYTNPTFEQRIPDPLPSDAPSFVAKLLVMRASAHSRRRIPSTSTLFCRGICPLISNYTEVTISHQCRSCSASKKGIAHEQCEEEAQDGPLGLHHIANDAGHGLLTSS